MEKRERSETIIAVLRRSRKSFIIEYVCALILMGLLIAAPLKGIPVHRYLVYFILGLAAVSILSAEWSRAMVRYIITPPKVIIIKGIIKQSKKNVHFLPLGFVPEINMKQTRLQRLLNYGTIFVHGSGENSFEIKDIDQPQEVLALIEELIEKNRAGRKE